MQISDLSPEARDAACAWLRSLGHEYYNRSVEQYEADEPIDVVETTEAQGSALYAAADALADLGPPLLPWGAEVRVDRPEGLPAALRAVAAAVEHSQQCGGSAAATFPEGVAASVTLFGPVAGEAVQP